MHVAEKANDESVRLREARLPTALARPNWLWGRRCLMAGLGPVGMLAAPAPRRRGAEVYGMDDLAQAYPRWGDHVAQLITHRHPYTDFETALEHHGEDEMKVVLECASGEPKTSPQEKGGDTL